jgi:hypothetical protein
MADGSTITALVAGLLLWIHANTGFEVPAGEPQIRFVAHGELEPMVCTQPCPVLGFTPEDRPDHIFLDRALDVTRDVCERSILLHEPVHYVQHREGRYAELPPIENGRSLFYNRGVAARGLAPPYC